MIRLLLLAMVFGLYAAPAAAQDGNLECLKAELAKYKLDREIGEVPRDVGERLLEDLGKASPSAVANLKAAVTYDVQQEAADSFARNKKFVLWAYGVIWLVPVIFAVMLWLRHKKLSEQLAELEARLSKEAGGD